MHDPYADGPTYPEAVAFPYPPKEPTAADSEDEDEWEDEEELLDFSASEEDEVEIQTRAAELAATMANRGPINEGEDSTDEEDSSDTFEDGKFYLNLC
jgi:hypothetical protein